MAGGSFGSTLAGIVWRGGGGVLFALTLGGCPGGAELEEPERFPQYPPVGGASGAPSVSGAPGVSGAGGATAGAAGSVSGSSGSAGAGGTGLSCDIAAVMPLNCSRSFCHDSRGHYAGLDFSNLEAMAALLVDKPALHGDIFCNAAGTSNRVCTPEELTAKGCPTNAMLIDSANFENSWIVKKLTPGGYGDCGTAMPAPPGNSANYGWSEARRTCYLEYFRSLIPPK